LLLVFGALAVYTVVKLARLVLAAPEWLWMLIAVALAIVVTLPFDEGEWWEFLAVAGMVEFLNLIENLLIVKADEALGRIQRRH